LHATAIERLLAENHWGWHWEGHRAGEEAGREIERAAITDPVQIREAREHSRETALAHAAGPRDDSAPEINKILTEHYQIQWRSGFDDGFEAGRASVKLALEHEARLKAATAMVDAATRILPQLTVFVPRR
jgi:flagellar biosynthesis/type III secretory pathway protein FliH